jgi:hypothetical protein
MKFKLITSIFLIVCLMSCSVDNDNNPQVIKTEWHLRNVSGGIQGIDYDFDYNVVIWEFNEAQGTVVIENNNTDDSIEDGLDSGTYSYEINDGTDFTFITIDNNELGNINILENELNIDTNLTSSGMGSDGYLYTFRKVEYLE